MDGLLDSSEERAASVKGEQVAEDQHEEDGARGFFQALDQGGTQERGVLRGVIEGEER